MTLIKVIYVKTDDRVIRVTRRKNKLTSACLNKVGKNE